MNLFNYGSNVQTWIEMLMIIITVLYLFWIGKSIYLLVKTKLENKDKYLHHILFKSFGFIILIMFFFFAFGSGKKPDSYRIQDQEGGYMEMVEEYPEPKPVEDIRIEARESKNKFLKKQDGGFEEERQEADDYISGALKRAKERENEME